MDVPPNIYHYNDFASFFQAACEHWKTRDARFSYRWLAKRVQVKTHSFLVKIAQGEKTPSEDLLERLCVQLELTPEQTTFARALLAWQTAKTPAERDYHAGKLAALRRDDGERMLAQKELNLLERWFNVALLELGHCEGAPGDAAEIAARLLEPVAAEEVQAGLDELIEAGLLRRTADGRLERTSHAITTSHKIPATTIREFHKKLLSLAQRALDEVPVAGRVALGHTMAIDRARLGEAQDALIEFRQRFENSFSSRRGDAVYHLALQLFPLVFSPDRVRGDG